MHQSHAIEVSGRSARTALGQGGMFRFAAVGPKVGMLDRSLWLRLPDIQKAVTQLTPTVRLPDAQADTAP